MSMMLLPKSEVAAAKSKDKALEVAEGVKIARRVDALREIAAEEEVSLKKFRENTLADIHAAIERESEPLNNLRKEVAELQQQREVALKPITAELKTLEEVRERISRDEEKLAKSREKLDAQHQSLEGLMVEVNRQFSLAKTEREQSIELLQHAIEDESRAKELRKDAEILRINTERIARDTEASIVAQNQALSVRERNQKLRDEAQDRREVELNARESKLTDREKTLERTIKRYA